MNKPRETFASKILKFLKSLQINETLPRGIGVLNPYQQVNTFTLSEKFYTRYYSDNNIRRIILGINPGRLGAGLTGIPFTDPVHLEQFCHIQNDFPKKVELSSTFIHEMMMAYGGLEKFYSTLYFSSVSPLGFIKEEKNLNYYDDSRLQKKLEPFIISCLETQLEFGVDRSIAYCLGEGANYKYLQQLNEKHHFFKTIIPLAHPRFIMQYKRKFKNDYINQYINTLAPATREMPVS